METSEISTISQPSRKTNFQSIEEFMREQDELDAIKLAEAKARAEAAAPSKKARKTIDIEALALEARALEEIGETNWIGRLHEYRSVHPPTTGLKYVDGVVGQAPARFTCIAALAESPQPFGDAVSFTKKKDAKQYASKKAIDWLIENKFMPVDQVKFPKKQPKAVSQAAAGTAKAAAAAAAASAQEDNAIPAAPPSKSTSTSFAGQIPDLCIRLGFNMPKYEITRASEIAPLYSGYAHFNGDPRIEGKVGEVFDVFGQKNAKEKIAEEVFSFLKDIERQRMALYEDDAEEEDRKRKRSMESPEVGNTSGKAIKAQA